MIWLLLACTVADRPLVNVPLRISALDDALPILEDGTELALTEASVQLASLTLYEPESGLALLGPFGSSVAHAHPGHEADGDVVAELGLGPLTLDLLDGDETIDGLQIYAGRVGTASVVLTGEARFLGSLGDTPVELIVPLEHMVSGIPVELDIRAEGPQPELSLTTSAARLLQWTPLDTPAGSDGILTPDDAESLLNGLRFGLFSTAAWTLEAQ